MATDTVLYPPQRKALELLAQKSRDLRLEWVEAKGDPRPVRSLEQKHFITISESGGKLHARLTAAGWKHLGQQVPEFPKHAGLPPAVPGYGEAVEADLKAALMPAENTGSLREIGERKPLVKPFSSPNGGPRPPIVTGGEDRLVQVGTVAHPAFPPLAEQIEEQGEIPTFDDVMAEPFEPAAAGEPADDPAEGLVDERPAFAPVRKRVEYDCGPDCVHEHVLVLLREMYPEIREAAEILRRAKEVERRLGL